MKDVEGAANEYFAKNRVSIYGGVDVIDAFLAGAEWQKQKEQKEWSKEDLEHIKSIIHRTEVYGGNCLYGRAKEDLEWLKNLLNRFLIQPKPAWSEEDENALKYLHELISFGFTEKFFDAQTASDMREWLNTRLKSLRPQWHPSEEQLVTLLRAEGIVRVHDTKELAADLAQLYEQLKAIKEDKK